MLGRVSEDSLRVSLNCSSVLQRYPSTCGIQCEQKQEEGGCSHVRFWRLNKTCRCLSVLSYVRTSTLLPPEASSLTDREWWWFLSGGTKQRPTQQWALMCTKKFLPQLDMTEAHWALALCGMHLAGIELAWQSEAHSSCHEFQVGPWGRVQRALSAASSQAG